MKIRTAVAAVITIALLVMHFSGSNAYAGTVTLKEVQNGYFIQFPKSDGNKPIKTVFDRYFTKPKWGVNGGKQPTFEGIGSVDNRRVKFLFTFSRDYDDGRFMHIVTIHVNGKAAYISNADGLITIPDIWYGPIRLDANDVIYTIYMSNANMR